MENDRITSHKLNFHPDRVAKWMDTREEYPINAEIAISGACNHRCIFCSADYMKYVPTFLTRDLMRERMKEMHELGLKSVLLAGNGEPLVNKDAVYIINDMKDIGLDVALSTNGVLLTKEKAEKCMSALSWIRFSVSAGTEETYKKIHRGKDGDLLRLFHNIEDAVQIKRIRNLSTILNVQIVMTPDNVDEVITLAKKVKELGADRYILKSVGWLPNTESNLRNTIDRERFYNEHQNIEKKLLKLNDDNFECVYRFDRINKLGKKRDYYECLASVFHVCIDSNGNVLPCCEFMGISEMAYGNINTQSFSEIWAGDTRKKILHDLKQSNLKNCPEDCRLDNMNRYLQELINPGNHVNFI